MFRVGGNVDFSVFRYQHAGILNAKLWHWGSKPKRGPITNSFASQWNIGLKDPSLMVLISTPGVLFMQINKR